MSVFLPSQILGWHSTTGSAIPIVKRFKLYMTSNPDTRAVSVALLYLIQCNFSGIYTPKPKMHTGSVFPRFIQIGALGVCKLSHLLIFVFQTQIDLEILNFQHYNISIKMIPLCHSTQKHPAGAECLSPDLCSVIPLSRYRPER